ncbi:MAG: zinc ribbon domain-containing protein [Anaerolineae bacterium]|nr:zinc ribbon domain-containing protein [Anaerolineae bacterium]
MPIYEYACPECDIRFDKRRSMADADMPIACPSCGSLHPRRALSLFATVGGSSKSSTSSGGGSGCSGCSGGSCSSCGH